ncbi:PorT family protein [Flavobacteriaceae bacterium]|nr:PorT family protein [Flavobacteriaceae bacterium]
MKTKLITLLLLSLILKSWAQGKVDYLQNFDKKTFHWGYYLGFNQTSFEHKVDGEYGYSGPEENPMPSTSSSFGFNVGLVGDYRLTQYLNLRLEPGLFTSGKKSFTPVPGTDNNIEWNSTYFRLPLLLKVSTKRLKNLRPYFIGGVSYDYNFKNTNDALEGSNYAIHKNQFMAEMGVGIDFYLHYFKCSPSIRGIYSLTDELDNWGGAPYDSLKTRGVFFMLTFE